MRSQNKLLRSYSFRAGGFNVELTGIRVLMTECSQQSFGFEGHFSRQVTVQFDGGQQTSDGGGLLLRETDHRLNLLSRFAACFMDGRAPERIDHTVDEMVAQRVYGLALGYEDLNDHDQLRHDPLLAMLAGRKDPDE